MEKTPWNSTDKRFVAFFDIMGFKDLVERSSHNEVVEKLSLLKSTLKEIQFFGEHELFKEDTLSESKSVTFSDSIIIFSKGDSVKDLCKVLLDAAYILHQSIRNGIGIKGAISFGEITVDFDNSLFFGRPIIDAYLLHDQLQLYSVVIDNNVEKIINSTTIPMPFNYLFSTYKTILKSGKVNHLLINPTRENGIPDQINALKKMYESVSGTPRIYIDNTIDFVNSIKSEK